MSSLPNSQDGESWMHSHGQRHHSQGAERLRPQPNDQEEQEENERVTSIRKVIFNQTRSGASGLSNRLNEALHSLNASIAATMAKSSTADEPQDASSAAAAAAAMESENEAAINQRTAAATSDFILNDDGAAISCIHRQCIADTLPPVDASDGEVLKFLTCMLCNNTLPALRDVWRLIFREREQVDHFRQLHATAERKLEQKSKENVKLTDHVKELEDRVDGQADEIVALKHDVQSISAKLVHEVQLRAEIQVERDRISEELEELTQSLFEQANDMVADEAKKRHQLEMAQRRIAQELQKTKAKLESERLEVLLLRKRLSDITVASLKSSMDRPTEASASVTDSQRSNLDAAGDASTAGKVGGANKNDAEDLRASTPPSAAMLMSSEIPDGITAMNLGSLPLNDSFLSLDIDFLPDLRQYESFLAFFERLDSIPAQKLLSGHAFIKACYDEHVEPCARLPRIAARKIVDAIQNGTLHLQVAPEVEEPSAEGEASDANRTDVEPTLRTPSPQKFWSTFGASTPSTGDRNLCGSCGREQPCAFQMILNAPSTSTPPKGNTATSSTSSLTSSMTRLDITGGISSTNGGTPIWIDVLCRDRILSVWEFMLFLRRLFQLKNASVAAAAATSTSEADAAPATAEAARPATEVDVKQLYVEYLRHLKQMFYARLGVLSYFRRVQQQLRQLESLHKEIVQDE
jgi:hypothetical protein